MTDEEYMKIAIEESKNFSKIGEKKPYGAVIVKDNKVVSSAYNNTRINKDPTAHAEINAIRKACKILNTRDLPDCTLYSTCEPCPMCFAAAWWAKIPKIVYGINLADTVAQGKRQINVSCEHLNQNSGNKIEIKPGVLRQECLDLFKTSQS